MAQISKGDTFTNGEQVTGARLNQLVDSSTLLVGAITDQPSITANTLEATDTTIVNDAGTLKEATIGDILNSNLPITASSVTTSAINGVTGANIAVAPASGQKFDVNGAFESTTSNTTGNSTIGGTLEVTGNTTLTGNLFVTGTSTFNNAPQVLTSVIKPRFDYFVQTRSQNFYSSTWGGLQNLVNIYGVQITPLNITFTPQKAGNKVVLTWTIFGECQYGSFNVFLVTRTPNSGVGAGVAVALPDSVDSSNNTWSGVSTYFDGSDDQTPQVFTVKIIDNNTLDVNCTYAVHFRASANSTNTFFLNRSVTSTGGLSYETGMSLGHAHEIYT